MRVTLVLLGTLLAFCSVRLLPVPCSPVRVAGSGSLAGTGAVWRKDAELMQSSAEKDLLRLPAGCGIVEVERKAM